MAVYTKIRSSALSGSIPGSGEAAGPSGGLALTDLDSILDHVASSVKRIHGAATFSEAAAGEFTLNITPVSDAAHDLGSSAKEWKDLYIDGVAYIDTLNADALGANLDHNNFNSTNVDIDSGAIDGAIIGANSAVAGTFSTMTATTSVLGTLGGNVDHSNYNSTNVDIDSGAIDGTVIGAANPEAGTFDAVVGTTATFSGLVSANAGIAVDTNKFTVADTSGNVVTAGTLGVTGVGTFTAQSVHTGGIESGGDILSDTDSTDSLGSTGVRWSALWADAMTLTDNASVGGTLGVTGTSTVAAVNASGIVDITLATDASDASGDTGALRTEGGASIAKKLYVGTDLSVGGASALIGNVTITGNLDVNGTTTTVDTANMTIEDRIIGLGVSGTVGEGPYSNLDTGIVFGYGAGFDKQQGLFLTGGSTFHLGKSITSPASASMAIISAADYADLTVGEVHFESVANKLRVAGSDLIMDSGGDILLDPAGNQVFIDADAVPNSDGVRDLGSAAKEWKDLYIDGVAYVDDLRADLLGAALDCANQTMTNVDINSGAIDGAAIGSNTAAGGAFTSLSATLITDLNGDVNLGNATSDTITATGRFDSDLTPSADNVRDLGEAALRYAEGHINVAHIDSLGQALDCNNNAMTNVDIDTGAIELIALNIDGGTSMDAALANADLIIIDDGAGGTNKKATMNLVADYIFGEVQKVVLVPGPVVAGGDVAVGFNIYAGTYASANEKLREVYVNGQLQVEDVHATQGNGNKDFYKGTGQTNLRFEHGLLDGDVVTVILRGTIG